MLRTFACSCLIAVLALPAAAADLPIVVNLPSGLAKVTNGTQEKAAPEKKTDVQLPEVINLPSGTDGSKPIAVVSAINVVRPSYVPPSAPITPITGFMAPLGGYMATAFAGPTSNYYASSVVGTGYYDPGFSTAPAYAGGFGYGGGYYAGGYYGAFPVPAYAPMSGYFYNFAPPAVLYRDILTMPLGKTVRIPPGGIAVPNPGGIVFTNSR